MVGRASGRLKMLVFSASLQHEQTRPLPTDPLTILEPQNPSFDKLNIAQKRRQSDFESLKPEKGRSGP